MASEGEMMVVWICEDLESRDKYTIKKKKKENLSLKSYQLLNKG